VKVSKNLWDEEFSHVCESRWSGLLLTHVSVKSELILSLKPCPNFRGGQVYNRGYSSKFGAAGKAKKDRVRRSFNPDFL